MTDNTKIEWADATVNAINGCSVVSPGCTNCYAMRSGGRNLPNYPSTGLTKPSKGGHVWTGEVRLNEKALLQPMRWKSPRRIFWNAHGDMFHENVPDEWIDRCFAVMALTPQHIHMVLTKRPERMRAYFADPKLVARLQSPIVDLTCNCPTPQVRAAYDMATLIWPLLNVWLGTSVEDQQRADERIPHLLATSAAVRFLSCEPLLGPVDLCKIRVDGQTEGYTDALTGGFSDPDADQHEDDDEAWVNVFGAAAIDWVITGGESGPSARPMHPDWVRSLRDQCEAAGVPFHFKQWGEWLPYLDGDGPFTRDDPEANRKLQSRHIKEKDEHSCAENLMIRVGKKRAGRLLDGVAHDGMPS